MKTIIVSRTIRAPIVDLFAILTDHESYTKFAGISEATLLRHGTAERNGMGAIRRIRAGQLSFDEEIIEFQAPVRMDYQIIKSTLPLKHYGTSIQLSETAAGTEITLTAKLGIKVPVLGHLLDKFIVPQFERNFAGMLKGIEKRAKQA